MSSFNAQMKNNGIGGEQWRRGDAEEQTVDTQDVQFDVCLYLTKCSFYGFVGDAFVVHRQCDQANGKTKEAATETLLFRERLRSLRSRFNGILCHENIFSTLFSLLARPRSDGAAQTVD